MNLGCGEKGLGETNYGVKNLIIKNNTNIMVLFFYAFSAKQKLVNKVHSTLFTSFLLYLSYFDSFCTKKSMSW